MRLMNTLIAGAALSAASSIHDGYSGGNIKGEGTLRAEKRLAAVKAANAAIATPEGPESRQRRRWKYRRGI